MLKRERTVNFMDSSATKNKGKYKGNTVGAQVEEKEVPSIVSVGRRSLASDRPHS
jgi:hypothetical protein